MIQGESHRVFWPQGFPPGGIQVFKTNPAFKSGKTDGSPQANFRLVPGNPGVFPFFGFPGFPCLHHEDVSVPVPGQADQAVTADEQAQAGCVARADAFRADSHFRRGEVKSSSAKSGSGTQSGRVQLLTIL